MNVFILYISSTEKSEYRLAGVFTSEVVAHQHAREWTELVGGIVGENQYAHSDSAAGDNLAAYISKVEVDSTNKLFKWREFYTTMHEKQAELPYDFNATASADAAEGANHE